jgi:hypothetical protein
MSPTNRRKRTLVTFQKISFSMVAFLSSEISLAGSITFVFRASNCRFTVASEDTPKLDSVDSPVYTATCTSREPKISSFSCTFVAPDAKSVTKSMGLSMPWGKSGIWVLLSEDSREEIRFGRNFISSSTLNTIAEGKIIAVKQCVGKVELNKE